MTVSFPGVPTCVKTGEIKILSSCAVTDPSPADDITRLITDENDSDPLGNRTPVIFIHGNHGNQLKKNSFDDIGIPNRDYFKQFLSFFNKTAFKRSYKIYRFHYVSDRYSASELARALRNDIDSEICQKPEFDKPFVIISHSMGGLVARSYMNQYTENVGTFAGMKAGDRVSKLITLATPHHGSPGAGEASRLQLATNKLWKKFLTVGSFFYWGVDTSKGIRNITIKDTIAFDHPNRSDLWWDNFDNVASAGNPDINEWLQVLNLQEHYDSKTIVYYGYVPLDDPGRQRLVKYYNADALLVRFDRIAFDTYFAKTADDEHSQLQIANIVIDYGMNRLFALNDGLVPIESGAFRLHAVRKRVACPRFDHLDMKDDNKRGCANGLRLFQNISNDLLNP